jgi:hypothetical protein
VTISTRQMKIEVLIIGSLLNARAHNVLYSGVCSDSRVCAGVCEGVSIVPCNETSRIDIRLIDDQWC